jgi:hypothetical protein
LQRLVAQLECPAEKEEGVGRRIKRACQRDVDNVAYRPLGDRRDRRGREQQLNSDSQIIAEGAIGGRGRSSRMSDF